MALKKKLQNLIADRPEYTINEEAFDNQSIARARAFGRDPSIRTAEELVDTDVANAIGQAKNISGSTGSILDTLRSISDSGIMSKRNLAMQEAQLQNQKVQDLYGINNAMIDEKDKAWNFNVNEPYQNQIQELRDRRKFRQELLMKTMDLIGSIGGAALTGGASLATKAVA